MHLYTMNVAETADDTKRYSMLHQSSENHFFSNKIDSSRSPSTSIEDNLKILIWADAPNEVLFGMICSQFDFCFHFSPFNHEVFALIFAQKMKWLKWKKVWIFLQVSSLWKYLNIWIYETMNIIILYSFHFDFKAICSEVFGQFQFAKISFIFDNKA